MVWGRTKIDFKIKGIDGVRRMFRKLQKNAPVLAREICKQLGTEIKRKARELAPKKTGKLARSIHKRTIKQRDGYLTHVWVWVLNRYGVEYGHIMEGGAKEHLIPNAFGIPGLVVKHPGTQKSKPHGYRFMARGRRYGEKVMKRVIETKMRQLGFIP